MYIPGQPEVNRQHALAAARLWDADPCSVEHIGDFGNCCYHWYISDLAIALSTLRRWPRDERDRYRDWLLAGYQEIFPIDHQLLANISWFIRLRILYVYLDRLLLFGSDPTVEQRATLCELRWNVHERFEWGG